MRAVTGAFSGPSPEALKQFTPFPASAGTCLRGLDGETVIPTGSSVYFHFFSLFLVLCERYPPYIDGLLVNGSEQITDAGSSPAGGTRAVHGPTDSFLFFPVSGGGAPGRPGVVGV